MNNLKIMNNIENKASVKIYMLILYRRMLLFLLNSYQSVELLGYMIRGCLTL